METRNCQNCKQNFVIEPDDFSFYRKMNVSPPTFCPECRMKRRMIWRNEQTLYKRKCCFTDKDLISIFHPDGPITVCDPEYWRSDKFDAIEYGMDLDLSKPFFEQYFELSKRVPLPALWYEFLENSPFNHYCTNLKDCYFCFRTHRSKNAFYSYNCRKIEDSLDCHDVNGSRSMYESIDVEDSELSTHIEICDHISRSHFLFNCRNCVDCFMSSNLSGKQYYFRNQKMSKEAYDEALKKELLGSYSQIESLKREYKELKNQTIRKGDTCISTANSAGAFLLECNNTSRSFFARLCENLKFGSFCNKTRDTYDVYAGSSNELNYENAGVGHTANVITSHQTTEASNISYSGYCDYVQNIFGCIGLQNKSYCILNKQYTKEEYEKLIPQIIKSMNDTPYTNSRGIVYRYGEFYPFEFSPFAYNESIAQDYFPITKEIAEREGYLWSEKNKYEYKPTISSNDLPDVIDDVTDEILNEVISCIDTATNHENGCEVKCPGAFKITKQELELYRIMNIPIPRKCPQCRFSNRFQTRTHGFLKLQKRQCMCSKTGVHFHGDDKCTIEFVSPFSVESPETVYCEKCYQQEMV